VIILLYLYRIESYENPLEIWEGEIVFQQAILVFEISSSPASSENKTSMR